MPMTDDELLDFDAEGIPDYEPEQARRNLEEHGDAFRYQLIVARHLQDWAARAEVTKRSPTTDISWVDGQARTLREVAAHLRAGQYLPGGSLYEATTGE